MIVGSLLSALLVTTPIPTDSLQVVLRSQANASISWHGGLTGVNGNGVTWPQASSRQYIFGGGIWVSAPGNGADEAPVMMSYNPLTGRSWMRPGTAQERDLSDTELQQRFGVRDADVDELGELALSLAADHHVVSQYTASSKQHADPSSWTFTTSPSGIDVDITQHTFGWTSGALKDAIVFVYKIRNVGKVDIGPLNAGFMIDPDLVDALLPTKGVGDDRIEYSSSNSILRMISVSSADNIAGDMGVMMLEAPTTTRDGFAFSSLLLPEQQAGLQGVHLFNTTKGLLTNKQRHDLMTARATAPDTVVGDVSALLTSHGFRLHPGQSARMAIAIVFGKSKANAGSGLPIDAKVLPDIALNVYDAYYSKMTTDIVAGEDVDNAISATFNDNVITVRNIDCKDRGTVEVVSLDGTVVSKATISGTDEVSLLMKTEPRGMYIVRHTCEDHKTSSAKVFVVE